MTWPESDPTSSILQALEKYGQIKHEEMFEIFNMGWSHACSEASVERVKELLDEPVYEIGRSIEEDRCVWC